ncbi:hypothetical protein ASG57_29825 [Bradyrhizobium sp. Leaf396]|jgi:hypothetical protein|nr:hypothetical protein ASG57_29825 [Bradyrhizobium sp. Leaf396]
MFSRYAGLKQNVQRLSEAAELIACNRLAAEAHVFGLLVLDRQRPIDAHCGALFCCAGGFPAAAQNE